LNLHFNKFMGDTVRLFRRDAEIPLFGKNWTAVSLTVIQPVTQLLQVHQAVNVTRADEESQNEAAGMTSQVAMNIEACLLRFVDCSATTGCCRDEVNMLEADLNWQAR
jgi:hypothetical protein